MDKLTINAYNQTATEIAKLHNSLTPNSIYSLVNNYFIKHFSTIDIGCGIGRDSQWLLENNYNPIGVDASLGMLTQCKLLHPNINYHEDGLPHLNSIKNSTFINVLCSAVIMHIKRSDIKETVKNITRITKDNGHIIVSYRGTLNKNFRENNKLYQPIDKNELISLFKKNNTYLLLSETDYDENRNLEWTNIVFKKLPNP